jgi:hypothetical protein
MGRPHERSEHPEADSEDMARDEQVPADEEARRAYIEELRERGEAAEPDENGELPPGATHEIVERPGKAPDVRRRRFSLG